MFELRKNYDGNRDNYFQALLEEGDLFIMSGNLQNHYQHQVPADADVGSARYNLTFRFITAHTRQCAMRGYNKISPTLYYTPCRSDTGVGS